MFVPSGADVVLLYDAPQLFLDLLDGDLDVDLARAVAQFAPADDAHSLDERVQRRRYLVALGDEIAHVRLGLDAQPLHALGELAVGVGDGGSACEQFILR